MWRPLDGRVVFAAPVIVAGVSPAGKAFSAPVYTADVSRYGVRLDGATFLQHPGDHVTLTYGNRSARYRVAWVGSPNSRQQRQVGLAILEGEPYLWGTGTEPAEGRSPATSQNTEKPRTTGDPQQAQAPPKDVANAKAKVSDHAALASTAAEKTTPSRPSYSGQERRATPRYACDRAVLCWKEGERVPLWGKLRDLGQGGCFVETPRPFSEGTAVSLVMMLYGYKIHARAEVRVHRPGSGMGLRFITIPDEDRHKMQAVLERLSDPGAERSGRMNNDASVLQQLRSWFKHNATLDREQFYRFLNRPKSEK